MKSVGFLKTLGSVVAMVVACNVYAQASDAPSTMAAPAASAKATKKANSQLGRKVRGVLAKSQGIDVSNIAVRARGGAVTLTGSVPNQGQIDAAGDAAKGVAGVTSVTNKLTVVQQ
ncbi:MULTISPECIES: BON domain-containing protein [Paraburkholderia]|uniref:Osmotically-inducible protein OsmY n=2 Tax=Paraburkholderia TaxID=1822464 RepID=A0A7Y9WDZ1_9BURK|nr:BON domain-containing protein [Paraburkholderia bryophila]NYH18481.1 osmotically-inducible protein OsmY [Paraburkholderia bryophila]NYH22418.1 osmotically-inducible protein OsmY [Paraburkholderia bryophila]